MPYQEQLADRLRIALTDHDSIEERKMFGVLCMMKRGNMLCGVMGNEFMFRVGAEEMDHALDHACTRPVQFGTNRPMRGFVWVEADAVHGDKLDEWIRRVDAFNASLIAK